MELYVGRLEQEGYGELEFHLPHRDVDQSNDDGGIRICKEHAHAMMDCDEVHVWLDHPETNDDLMGCPCKKCDKATAYWQGGPEFKDMCQCPRLSLGSYFDFGMAFMYFCGVAKNNVNFKFVIANGPLAKTEHKSFTNLLRYLHDRE